MNFTVFYLTTWYFYVRKKVLAIKVMTTVSVVLTFLTFLVIIGYHILWVSGKMIYVKRAEERMRHFFPQYYKKLFPPKRKCKRQLKNVDSFDESCSDFREPLLGDNF